MIRRFVAGLAVISALLFPVLATGNGLAYDPLEEACKGAGANSSACVSKANDPNDTLNKVTNLIALITGIIAVIMIIISGLSFITSGGDSQKASKARSMLISAIVGLIIVVLARAIVLFVAGSLR